MHGDGVEMTRLVRGTVVVFVVGVVGVVVLGEGTEQLEMKNINY